MLVCFGCYPAAKCLWVVLYVNVCLLRSFSLLHFVSDFLIQQVWHYSNLFVVNEIKLSFLNKMWSKLIHD